MYDSSFRFEPMSEAKEELLKLEQNGQFVFHGTHRELDAFTPQQAYNYDGVEQTADGEPAVFASAFAEYAIFMAIITEENCPKGYWSGAGMINSRLVFNATQDTLDQLTDLSMGWVYVFNKNDFEKRDPDGIEYVAHAPVTPIKKVRVSKADLPEGIEIRGLQFPNKTV